VRAAAAAGFGNQAGDLARAVADQRKGFPREAGKDQFSLFPFGQDVAGFRMDGFDDKMIFIDMHSAPAFQTLHGNARPHHFRKAEDVERFDVEGVFNGVAGGVAPELGAENAHPQLQGLHIHAHGSSFLGQMQGEGWCGAQNRRAEILENRDLPLGVAVGDGDDAGADFFDAVVQPQPDGEQTVAKRVVNHVVFGQPRGRQGAGGQVRPGLQVAPCVAEHGGPAGGSGRGVQPHDIAHRNGKKAEGIIVAQILACGEGKLF